MAGLSVCKRVKLDCFLTPTYKNWVTQDLSVEAENVKHLEENRKSLWPGFSSAFLGTTPKAQWQKKKVDALYFIKM